MIKKIFAAIKDILHEMKPSVIEERREKEYQERRLEYARKVAKAIKDNKELFDSVEGMIDARKEKEAQVKYSLQKGGGKIKDGTRSIRRGANSRRRVRVGSGGRRGSRDDGSSAFIYGAAMASSGSDSGGSSGGSCGGGMGD